MRARFPRPLSMRKSLDFIQAIFLAGAEWTEHLTQDPVDVVMNEQVAFLLSVSWNVGWRK